LFSSKRFSFERSESKTDIFSKMLHDTNKKIKKMRYRTNRMLRLFFEKGMRIFEGIFLQVIIEIDAG